MLKNYIKIAWRSLLKNKGFTLINLLGLATGFAISLLIVVYARYEFRILLLVLFTVSINAIRTAVANSIKSLRTK